MLRGAAIAGLVAAIVSFFATLALSIFLVPSNDLVWALNVVPAACFLTAFISWILCFFKNRKRKNDSK